MAQQISEPMSSVALEGSQVSASPSVALASIVAPRTFHFQAQGNPGIFGHHLATISLRTVIESVTMTTTRALEAQLNIPGLMLDTPTTTASPGLGSHPVGQSVSQPTAPVPSQALQFSIPTDGTPKV